MSETTITVRGFSRSRLPAEQAVATLFVRADGPQRDAVFAAATGSAESVRAQLTALAENTAVLTWSSNRVQLTSERPWNQDGKQLDPITHASIGFRATFVDFEALATWIESIASVPGVEVSDIAWQLTDDTIASAEMDARAHAVADARAKAQTFATAVGLDTVTATALADPGLLGDSAGGNPGTVDESGYPEARLAMKSVGFDGAAPSLTLSPPVIEISAAVDARFSAS
jgi:uncharacterized protein